MLLENHPALAAVALAAGLLILVKGADWLVSGSVTLAERLGVSPLVIGLTVVAMGTSAPELAAGSAAAAKGLGDVVLGNIYGSNIANLALIPGVWAMLHPIRVDRRALRIEIPVMLGATLLVGALLATGHLSRLDSLALLVVAALLIWRLAASELRRARLDPAVARHIQKEVQQEVKHPPKSLRIAAALIVLGLAALAGGGDLTVRSAVALGRRAGLSDTVIGMTIIAVGTSLPELLTCIMAALRNQHGIGVGNVVGSCIFNLLIVGGVAGMIHPFSVTARLAGPDFLVLLGVSLLFYVLALAGRSIGRLAGLTLLGAYGAYMVYLFVFTRGQ